MLTGGPGRPCRPVKPRCPFCPLSPDSPASPLSPRGPWGPWEQSVVISRVNLSLVAKPIFFCLFRPEIIQALACSFVSLQKETYRHSSGTSRSWRSSRSLWTLKHKRNKRNYGPYEHSVRIFEITIILTFNNLLVEISLIITVSFIFKI